MKTSTVWSIIWIFISIGWIFCGNAIYPVSVFWYASGLFLGALLVIGLVIVHEVSR